MNDQIMSRQIFKKHVDENRELLYSSIHEAGHVLAARHFGFKVAWVSIDHDFIKKNPLAIENNCSGEGVLAVAMTQATERMRPIIDRGFILAPGERTILHEYCAETICGPFAEKLVNPDWEKTAGNDFGQAQHFLWKYAKGTKARYDRDWIGVKLMAEQFVAAHEGAIEEFAFTLISKKTILENEIDNCIAAAKIKAGELVSI